MQVAATRQSRTSIEAYSQNQERVQQIHTRLLNKAIGNNIDELSEDQLPETFELLSMTVKCFFCGALGFKSEVIKTTKGEHHFGDMCCRKGEVKVPKRPKIPKQLQDLFKSEDDDSKFFLKNIRKFNSGMSMASFQFSDMSLPGPGMIRIQGQVQRNIGPLINNRQNQARNIQTYFLDEHLQAEHRAAKAGIISETDKEIAKRIFTKLYNCLSECNNTYLQDFVTIKEWTKKEKVKDVYIGFHADKRPKGQHKRRYNAPVTSEVALLMPNNIVHHNDKRMTIASLRQPRQNQGLKCFDDTHRCWDPMQYPVFYPFGTDGWKINMLKKTRVNNGKSLTLREYTTWQLMIRNQNPSPLQSVIHHGRRLFQQYVIDQWCRIESGRMRWYRLNQKELRSECYQSLQDSLVSNDQDLTKKGVRIVLPPTHTGSPRSMNLHYQDAMALVRRFGKPEFLITMTANGNWNEIQNQLQQGQSYTDRPDLIARVFNQKKKELIEDLKSGILGKCLSIVGVVEFQKRGLPHIHILIITQKSPAQSTTEELDKIICAEIPDQRKLPQLFEKVAKFNLHGPCNKDRCLEDGECIKHFPKAYTQKTFFIDDAYPCYRRRSPQDGGNTYTKHIYDMPFIFDNSHVVPYNPYMTQKYNCHINIEYLNSIETVKYLYKYIGKGSDQATVQLTTTDESAGETTELMDENDEILRYQNFRYVGPVEACCRIFEHSICYRYPAVMKLELHLENQHKVLFDPKGNSDDIQDKLNKSKKQN